MIQTRIWISTEINKINIQVAASFLFLLVFSRHVYHTLICSVFKDYLLENADPSCERTTSLTWMSCIVKKKTEQGLFCLQTKHSLTDGEDEKLATTDRTCSQSRTARMITLCCHQKNICACLRKTCIGI